MPFPENTPSLDDLVNLPAGELDQLPVELLAALQGELDHATRQLKAAATRLSAAMETRYATRAAEARRACGKDTGTIRFDDGAVTVIADLPKRVDWDQDKLAALVERIRTDGGDAAEYVDVAFKVPERKYAAWPSHIRSAFEDARTVRTGKPRFRLELGEAQS